jgi:copper chaperone
LKGITLNEQIINIKGMTCGHCEGRVTKELLAISGVSAVTASAEKGSAQITFSSEITADQIDLAVRAAGYSVIR